MDRLRFKDEFGNNYPSVKIETLGKLTKITKGKQLNKNDMLPEGYIYVLNGGIEPSGYTDKWNTPKNTITISEGGNSCGYVNFNKENFWSGGHNYSLLNPKIDSNFLYSFLKYKQNEIMRLRVGSGLPNIQIGSLAKFAIKVPSDKEQEKIGGFLSTFDKFIQKQQEKIDLLKELKKGYLQQMFLSKDSSVPKIRFKKFTEAWEQCELSDIMLDFIVPMRDKPKEFGGQIPWTRIEDIEGKYLNGTKSDQYVSESTVKMMNLKVIPRNSLIVSASATFGVVAIVNTDLITNQTFIGLVPRENYDLDFLYYLFYSSEVVRQMALKSAGSTIFYISRDQFKNMLISAPKLDEQIKVGKILSHLDNLITLHQLKLKSLEDLKQGYMQRLFL